MLSMPTKSKEVLFTEEAAAFVEGLSRVSKVKLLATTDILERQGYLNKPLAEKVEGQTNLFSITIHTSDNPRVFYAYDDGTVIWLLHGYYKKKNKIPLAELNKALAIKRRIGL